MKKKMTRATAVVLMLLMIISCLPTQAMSAFAADTTSGETEYTAENTTVATSGTGTDSSSADSTGTDASGTDASVEDSSAESGTGSDSGDTSVKAAGDASAVSDSGTAESTEDAGIVDSSDTGTDSSTSDSESGETSSDPGTGTTGTGSETAETVTSSATSSADDDFDGEYVLPGEQYYDNDWASEIELEDYAEEALFLVTFSNIRLLTLASGTESGISTASEEGEETAAVSASSTEDLNWSFDIYYVNQSDKYYVEKTADFTLKYQMEFHTSADLEAGAVEIRIPRALLQYRSGRYVYPSDIAVPQKPDDGDYTYSASMPFNWYVDEETDELVFFNYRTITAGTNIAWQVLYNGLSVMSIIDMTTWELQAEIAVTIDGEEQSDTPTALTGLVNTYVNLSSVAKTPLDKTGVSYTPGLYTKTQVSNYITYWMLEEDMETWLEENFDDYVYVVWDVKIKGNGTQPYNLKVLEEAYTGDGTEGIVLGYRKPVGATSYPNNITQAEADEEDGYTLMVSGGLNKDWGTEFYVVTAYPADAVESGTTVYNNITVKLEAFDEIDEDQYLSDSASWNYSGYTWTYSGNILSCSKENDETLKAWVNAYADDINTETDMTGLSFLAHSGFRGYSFTHVLENDTFYDESISSGYKNYAYIEGSYYTVTLTDGTVTAAAYDENNSYINGQTLTSDDYYFSEVYVYRSDTGIDIYEDKTTTDGVEHPDDIDQDMYIYALFVEESTDAGVKYVTDSDGAEWELVTVVDCSEGSFWSYSFTDEQIAREPYKVKTVYNSVNYYSACSISVDVALKYDSDILQNLVLNDNEQIIAKYLKITNTASLLGQAFHNYGESRGYFIDGALNGNITVLTDATLTSSATKKLTAMVEQADAVKTYSTSNDPVNQRVNITYGIRAFEGYKVTGKDTITAILHQGVSSPGRNYVVFYDLLPYGVQYDASCTPTAYRITDISVEEDADENVADWTISERDTTQVEIAEVEVTADWRGTGRTMVAFHIYYSGADSAVYDDSEELWFSGWGISFKAYYDWADIGTVIKNSNENIAAFMPDAPADLKQSYLDGTDEDGEYESYLTRLLGLAGTEVAQDDGVIVPGVSEDDHAYDAFTCTESEVSGETGDLNDDGITEIYQVLYAKTGTVEDVAIASQDIITKTVRADANVSDEYGTVAYVNYGEGYTYNITLNTTLGAKDLILFDRLEYASTDRKSDETDYGFEDAEWVGTFVSVDTTALELAGIEPVVYYNASRYAEIPQTEGSSEETSDYIMSTYITSENGWLTEAEWIDKYGNDFSEVRAIAIDCRYSDVENETDFELAAGKYISYLIHMTAPESDSENIEEGATYAYNNPSYYSYSTYLGSYSWVEGDTVKVALGEQAAFEVIKEFSGDVPSSLQGKEFEFTLYTQKGDNETPYVYFSERTYTLYTWNDDLENDDGTCGGYEKTGTGATTLDGTLYLKAGQKAVFEEVPTTEIEKITVEEEASVFWETEVSEAVESEGSEGNLIYTVTVTNSYHPVLYVQKLFSGVPSGVDVSDEEFTLQVSYRNQGEEEWTLLSDATYWYVDKVRTNGATPAMTGTGITDNEGCFTIRKGEIIALFMTEAGTEYRIVEVDTGDDWICKTDTRTGTMVVNGNSESITNIYKWKNLSLTKEITHQGAEDCTQEFTFKVQKVLTDEDGNQTEELEIVSGNTWYLMDSNGYKVYTEKEDGDGSYICADGSGNYTITVDGAELTVTETELDDTSEEGYGNSYTVVGGTLNKKGEFTVACAGYTVIIEKLEAEGTYLITETDSGDYYVAASDTVEVTMPLYSTSASATITNDWQMRPLSVTKYVITNPEDEDAVESASSAEFTMTLYVNGKIVINFPYTVTENGVETDTGTTGTDGTFTIKSGQTITFTDLGFLGDTFEVKETLDTAYPQVYPTDEASHTGTLSGDGSSVTFVNGVEGNLMISKSYTADDDDTAAKAYLAAIEDGSEDAAVDITLIAADSSNETYQWPEKDMTVTLLYSNGDTAAAKWEKGGSFHLEPGVTLVIPASALKSMTSYTLTESSEDRHKVFEWDSDAKTWLEISQSYPENDEAFSGTIEENPVVTLVNHVTSLTLEGSEISKHMSAGSYEVSEGTVLVWQVQAYDGASWAAAEGIRYLIFDDNGVVSTQVMTTDSDGKIKLTRTANGYPAVKFLDKTVFVNLYSSTDIAAVYTDENKDADGYIYRLVELTDESDDTWGLLAGYGTDADSYSYDISLSCTEATAFVNSNRQTALKIVKEMSDGSSSDDRFTFVLSQVLSLNSSVESESDILASIPAVGVEYAIYDAETGEEVGAGITSINGEFSMKAGQYVLFNLPDGTIWTVTETAKAGYYLESLENDNTDSGGDWTLKKLSDNLMLIRQADTTLILTAYAIDPNVYTEEDIEKDNLVVTAYFSDGSSKVLDSGDFDIDPSETGSETGELAVTVTYMGASTEVTLNVSIKEIEVNAVYAVQIYGINVDTCVDENGNEVTAGLTFGHAIKANYNNTYSSHLKDSEGITSREEYEEYLKNGGTEICLHWMTWDEIIAQSQNDPAAFQSCLENGCTHSVELSLNDTIAAAGYTYTGTGDGAGSLYYTIKTKYLYWNSDAGSETANANYWSASRIRATLNGYDGYTNKTYAGEDVLDESTSLLSCFPETLQDAIIAKVVSANVSATGESSIEETQDKLWLLAMSEIKMKSSMTIIGNDYIDEGSRYRIFECLCSTTSHYIAYNEKGVGSEIYTRTRYYRSTATNGYLYTNIWRIGNDGANNYYYTSARPGGLAPCFCLPGPSMAGD